MKKVKIALLTIAVAVMSSSILLAQQTGGEIRGKISIEVIVGDKAPTPTERGLMQQEEKSHPNIAKAMRDMKAAMKALDDAPDDFGGHKAQAEQDLKTSYVSLRKALYYRLYEDTH